MRSLIESSLRFIFCVLFIASMAEAQTSYCAAKGASTAYGWINQIVMNDLDNSSGNNAGYNDFTSKAVTLEKESTVVFELHPGFASTARNQSWKIFIDFNQNKVFETSENVATGTSTGTTPFRGSFTLPFNLLSGETRMRVVMRNIGTPVACGSFSFGEVEDYKAVVIEPNRPQCVHTPTRNRYFVLAPDKNPGTPQHVKVVDTFTGRIFREFVAYELRYAGGTRIAVDDLDGDGIDEIITGPGRNRLTEVRVFALSGSPKSRYPQFAAYDATVTGGIDVATADVNGDCKPDIITVPTYGAADVRVFLQKQDPSKPPFSSTPDFSFVGFSVASIGGFLVTGADMGQTVAGSFVNVPDGKAEIVIATNGGIKTEVKVFDTSVPVPVEVQSFYPFSYANPNFLGGAKLEVAQLAPNSPPAIILGSGVNGISEIEVWNWNTTTHTLSLLGRISNVFTGNSNNAPVEVAAIDYGGDGIADAIYAVQGPIGAVGEVHRFEITSTAPFQYRQAFAMPRFRGPWFIAAHKVVGSLF